MVRNTERAEVAIARVVNLGVQSLETRGVARNSALVNRRSEDIVTFCFQGKMREASKIQLGY